MKSVLIRMKGYPIFAPRPGGEIGRRTVFRWRRREVCWFESSPGHVYSLVSH